MTSPRTPSFRLDGRRALVTGAGRGIGLAAAHALAQAGAVVTLAARSLDELRAAGDAIAADGGKAEVLVLDVTEPAAVRQAVAAAGPFQVLVNSAGTNRPALITETRDEDFDAVVDLNLKAAFYLAREVARGLIGAGLPGSLIQISSQMGHVGGPKRAVYCATIDPAQFNMNFPRFSCSQVHGKRKCTKANTGATLRAAQASREVA